MNDGGIFNDFFVAN